MKNKLLKVGLLLIVIILLNYFMLIPLNIRYGSIFFLFLMLVAIILIMITYEKGTIYEVKGRIFVQKEKITKPKVLIVIPIIAVIGVILTILSTPLFWSKSYASLIGEEISKDFATNYVNTDLNVLPIVDSEYAKVLGDKKLGSDSGLGSEFHVGEFTDIIYNDKFYLVAPLEYNDFFKWLNNKSSGTPGYILIDKTTANVELVRTVNGNDVSLKYVESAYLGQDLTRKAYMSGNFDNVMLDPFFELDEVGNPYFIIPKVKKTIFWSGGEDVYQVVVVNAATGKVDTYDVGDQPDWIDNIYPRDLIVGQLNYYGTYKNGFFNSLFSQKGLLTTTEGSRHIYDNDSLSIYTGLTSIGIDESTVGMAFVNAKTKEFLLYNLTGATEQAARKSAEGKVQDLGYSATFPIPVNINEEGAYFITLKDDEGLIKQYAFVNINDYSIVENASSISSAYEQYMQVMNYTEVIDNVNNIEITTNVIEIASEVNNGTTKYYLIVEHEGVNLILIANPISNELPFTKIGDSVSITIQGDKIIMFDNNEIE